MAESLNRVEFYRRGGGLIASCTSAAVPRQGEYVNIEKRQWRVAYVAWALDTDVSTKPALRANVELEKVADDQIGPVGPLQCQEGDDDD